MEPEDVTELLQSHDKTWMDEELVLRIEQRKWFLEMNSTLMKILWRLLKWQKGLDYDINLVDKVPVQFEWIDSNLERSTVGKMLSNIKCYRKIIHERKSQSIQQISLLSYFKKLS